MAKIIWRRRRRLTRLEAAIIGAAAASVALILQPRLTDLVANLSDRPYNSPSSDWSPLPSAEEPTAPAPPETVGGPLAGSYGAPPEPAVVVHAPPPTSGSQAVRVIDADTLEIDGERIRLHGIDAFERRQTCGGRPCGEEGRRAMEALTAGREVSCQSLDIDRYGRTIARCRAGGRDLGAEMVRSGHALAYERYSTDYVDEERAARSAGAGAWAHGDFIAPEDYRRGG